MPSVTVKFEMTDGRTLECRYGYVLIRGNYSGPPEKCYPDEFDVGEPTYYIDGELVDYDSLPKGLEVIADAMYENGEDDPRFTYMVEEPDYGDGDYEDPREWDEPY